MWQKVAKFKGAEYFRKALYKHTNTHFNQGTNTQQTKHTQVTDMQAYIHVSTRMQTHTLTHTYTQRRCQQATEVSGPNKGL